MTSADPVTWPTPQLAALAKGEVLHERVPRHTLGRWEWDVDSTRYVVHAATMVNTDPMDLFAGNVVWMVAAKPCDRFESHWAEFDTEGVLAQSHVAEKLRIGSATDARNLTLLIAHAIGREAHVDEVCPSCREDHRP